MFGRKSVRDHIFLFVNMYLMYFILFRELMAVNILISVIYVFYVFSVFLVIYGFYRKTTEVNNE